MRVLTFQSTKNIESYTEIHGSIAINSCQIKLAQKYIILLSKVSIVIYKAGVENTKFIHFNLWAGTYLIDDFNVKVEIAILQLRQGWEPPQIKDLRLVTAEDYRFMASHTIFITLGTKNKYLEKTMLLRSTVPPGSYKTSLDTSSPPRLLPLHCKQINKVKNEIDGQPSRLLAYMHVSNYKATFSPIHLVFLSRHIHNPVKQVIWSVFQK